MRLNVDYVYKARRQLSKFSNNIFCHCTNSIRVRYGIFRKVDASVEDLKTILFYKILSYYKDLNLLHEL